MSDRVHHHMTHASLVQDKTASPVSPGRGFDAIVVPASRPSLRRVISLSADLGVPLVALCSLRARVDDVARDVEATVGAQALLVEVPAGYELKPVSPSTYDEAFDNLSGDRSRDLSVKRNAGLLLARMLGWRKILYIDDDIGDVRPADVGRLAGYLESSAAAAMASRDFPDNSVVCHSRRLAGLAQDVFVGGLALGVNVQHPEVSYFPDVYNEDWFFFARQAARHALPKVGEVRQDKYDPFADPTRAARQEFGDLLGEGLYGLFEERSPRTWKRLMADATDEQYWRLVIEERQEMITGIAAALRRRHSSGSSEALAVLPRALDSLARAREQLGDIGPSLCVDFIDAWRQDDADWRTIVLPGLRPNGRDLSEEEALRVLDLGNWLSCGYGRPRTRSPLWTSVPVESLLESA